MNHLCAQRLNQAALRSGVGLNELQGDTAGAYAPDGFKKRATAA